MLNSKSQLRLRSYGHFCKFQYRCSISHFIVVPRNNLDESADGSSSGSVDIARNSASDEIARNDGIGGIGHESVRRGFRSFLQFVADIGLSEAGFAKIQRHVENRYVCGRNSDFGSLDLAEKKRQNKSDGGTRLALARNYVLGASAAETPVGRR